MHDTNYRQAPLNVFLVGTISIHLLVLLQYFMKLFINCVTEQLDSN